MIFVDRMLMDEAPRRTSDGYLVAVPRVARTGIQEYAGFEVGRPSVDTVRVYRPEDEVFHADALKSLAHRPVTIDHPPVMVDAKNWKEFSRGMTGGDVARDGDFIRVPMALMDNDAITAVEGGKAELSVGYTADLDWTPGVTPDGQSYDAIQRNIRGNHVAVVDAARGGSQLRVIDTDRPGGKPMSKKVLVDGITVEVSETAAEVFDRHTKAMADKAKSDAERIEELEDELEKLKADQKKDSETKDATIATLTKQLEDSKLTPAKLDHAVKARAEVIDSAKRVFPEVVTDGKSDSEIRRQVVDHALGETAKDWSDEQVSASFGTLAASTGTQTKDRVAAAVAGAGPKLTAYDSYVQRISNAHKMKREA